VAARNISDVYNLVDYITRKVRGVFISPSEFDESVVAANLEAFQYYWELSYKADQQLHDALQPFKVLRQQFQSAADGLVTFPQNYVHLFPGVFSIYGSTVNPCQFVDNENVPDALTNQLRPVSLSNPIAEVASIPNQPTTTLGFQMYPMQTQIGFYSYLRLPNQPHYGYVQVGRTITYDPLTSVQIEFTDVYVNNIISRALKYFGVSMGEAEIEQFAQSQTQQTQTP
jgi:hypothetical protein